MSGLDFAGLMRSGVQGLRLKPCEFWQLTPAELALMLGVGAGPQPLRRSGLQELIRAYPDQGPASANHMSAAQQEGQRDE